MTWVRITCCCYYCKTFKLNHPNARTKCQMFIKLLNFEQTGKGRVKQARRNLKTWCLELLTAENNILTNFLCSRKHNFAVLYYQNTNRQIINIQSFALVLKKTLTKDFLINFFFLNSTVPGTGAGHTRQLKNCRLLHFRFLRYSGMPF